MIASPELKVTKALDLFLDYVNRKYDHGDGRGPTRQADNVRSAVERWVRPYVGDRWLYEFDGPVFDAMVWSWVDSGKLGRKQVNRYISFVRDFIKFCVRSGYAQPDQIEAIRSVDRIRQNQFGIADPEPRQPVDDERYRLALPHLSPMVRVMVKLLYHTGMRPGEVRAMSARDLTQTEREGREVVLYTPKHHKTAHLGKRRMIPFVGDGLAVLTDWIAGLDLDTSGPGYLFSRDPRGRHMIAIDRINREVRQACLTARIEPWTPMQLRHRFATEAEAKLGNLKTVSPMMGHTSVNTTRIYAHPSDEAAIATALRLAH